MKSMLLRDSVKKASQFQKVLHKDPTQAEKLLEERRQLLEQAKSASEDDDSHSKVSLQSHWERLKRDENLMKRVLSNGASLTGPDNVENVRTMENMYELQEANSLDNSIRGTNELLERALATREDFEYQNSVLQNVSDRINHVALSIPFINQVLRKTKSRKQRDVILLSVLISTLTLLFFFFH
ncbi:SNARE Gos1 [Schizosaccharomyces cryophilus OY26]|uniref:SNARE Gos1 n=1 Tax=Schizosaccharomyces cryophilus (strain OY26 / ATCC MYA-4695 / CBS 11777 / NBRC 106824 / NRRL Y48691) TaxID=653667 RepID=S9W1Z8_SCHCR|nr:SNARE Gos1 [Schizosaccharomyces cryophilus OY26]EPY54073.1 SNARE Gos1 [Schizosaccharomyces cryophilus OY26]